MLGFGLWYLKFGTSWIAWYRGGETVPRATSPGMHLITGVQVTSTLLSQLTVGRVDSVIHASHSRYGYCTPEQEGTGSWKPDSWMVNTWYSPISDRY